MRWPRRSGKPGPADLARVRARFAARGVALTDDEIERAIADRDRRFEAEAPTTAAEAAAAILEGVKADDWRILVGEDTKRIDALVRAAPERAYDLDFYQRVVRETGWKLDG